MSQDSVKGSVECRELFVQLSAYIDGELSPEDRRALEEHLCSCAPCVEFVNSLRRTVELCRQFELETPSPPMSGEAKRQLLAACERMIAARRDRSAQ